MEIYIDNFHPTPLNKLMGVHYMEASRLKKSDREIVWAYAKKCGIPNAIGKRRVTLVIYLEHGQRATDPDSFQKSLGDAMVHAELLTDDNRQGVEWAPAQYERLPEGEARATKIIIEEIPEHATTKSANRKPRQEKTMGRSAKAKKPTPAEDVAHEETAVKLPSNTQIDKHAEIIRYKMLQVDKAKEELKDAKEDLKEAYKTAESDGIDKIALKEVLAEDPPTEHKFLVDLYRRALSMPMKYGTDAEKEKAA